MEVSMWCSCQTNCAITIATLHMPACCSIFCTIWQRLAESGNAFWVEAPTLNWTKASNLGLVRSHHIAACESLLETYFMQVSQHDSSCVYLSFCDMSQCVSEVHHANLADAALHAWYIFKARVALCSMLDMSAGTKPCCVSDCPHHS